MSEKLSTVPDERKWVGYDEKGQFVIVPLGGQPHLHTGEPWYGNPLTLTEKPPCEPLTRLRYHRHFRRPYPEPHRPVWVVYRKGPFWCYSGV